MDYKLDTNRDEVFRCAGCAKEFEQPDVDRLSSPHCPSCKKVLVSRYRKTESKDDVVKKWRSVNGLS